MAFPALPPGVRTTVLTLIAVLAGVLGSATTASAGTFPVIESFEHTTAPGWTLGGTAALTAAADGDGNGWLRLTPAQTSKSGYAFYDTPFPSNEGVLVDFDYASYGGTGADGFTFFLYDGATTASQFQIGAFGGGLGYISCGSTPGLKNAYIGVGIDEYGNFTNQSGCGLTSSGFHPNYVSVRGSQANTYPLLASAEVPKGIQTGVRTGMRHVTVALTPAGKLSVTLKFPDGTFQTAISNLQLPAAPATLKLGYAAATGGSTNIHEIRTTGTVKPTDLATTVSDGKAGLDRGVASTWTATVTNNGPNPTTGQTIKATTGSQSLTGVTWTCTASANASCGTTTSGTGLPSVTAGAMPIGGKLTYVVTGTPAATTDFAQLTVDAQPVGDTGDLAPSDNAATDTTDLAPVFDANPTVTVAANGTATATPAAPRGGSLATTYAWERCDASGASCTVIAGQTAATYATTSADRGATLRVKQTVTNAAGTASRESAPASALPATVLSAAPSGNVNTSSATFQFSSLTVGATFECSLDGAAYAACTSPKIVGSLADGSHTFAVRAVGPNGLKDPTPQTASWKVDTAAPTTTFDPSAFPLQTASRSLTITFAGTDSGAGMAGFQCQLDGAAWATCTSPATFDDLADGQHAISVRSVDLAGNPDPSPPQLTWTVDATAPTVAIDAHPLAADPSADAEIDFTAADGAGTGVDTVECKLDDADWEPCTSPLALAGLGEGDHTVAIRATDALGNTTAPATSYAWTVDTIAPTTTRGSGPAALSNSRSASFSFDGSDAAGSGVASYLCELDESEFDDGHADWVECTSPFTVSNVTDGDHTVRVRAVDEAGNSDWPGVAWQWTVDATAPATSITAAPGDGPSTTATFGFSARDNGSGVASYECRLDDADWAACTSPKELTGLSLGSHTFDVRATDVAGTTDPAPASFSWTVTAPTQPGGPGGTTPTTPTGTTPDPTTPTTPTETTPDPTTPTGTTPAGTTPDPTTPTGTTPDPTTPTGTTPSGTTPDPTTPTGTTPSGTTPDPTTPTTPTGTTPDPTTPTGTTPDPTTPSGTTPAPTTPTGTTPTGTTPTGTTPATGGGTGGGGTSGGGTTGGSTETGGGTPGGSGEAGGTGSTGGNGSTPTDTGTPTSTPSTPSTPATPAKPVIVNAPLSETTDQNPTFNFKPAPGATIRCSVDGGALVDCTGGLTLSDLTAGAHTLTAVQVDASGNKSDAATFQWTVKATKVTLTTRIAKKGKANTRHQVNVLCKMTGDTIKVCNVKFYARIGRKVVAIATGRRAIKVAGHASLGVKVKLTKAGLSVLARKPKGLKITVKAKAQPFKSAKVASNTRAKIKR